MECTSCSSECKPANPWPKSQSFITMGTATAAWLLGLYAIAREKPKKLPAYLAASIVIMTISRKALCARCPFYGKNCSMLIGKWAPLLYERSDKPLTRWSFIQDGLVGNFLFTYPLPELWKRSPRLFLAYQVALQSFLGIAVFRGCTRCPLEVCPVNRTLGKLGMKKNSG